VKVLLIGGTGVFGSRLARLLIRDEHQVTLAARNRARVQRLLLSLAVMPSRWTAMVIFLALSALMW